MRGTGAMMRGTGKMMGGTGEMMRGTVNDAVMQTFSHVELSLGGEVPIVVLCKTCSVLLCVLEQSGEVVSINT